MAANSMRPDMEASAPVSGGMRWRSNYQDRLERYGRRPRYIIDTPVESPEREFREREPGAILAPGIAGTPPVEARAGELYVHQPRASDGIVDAFTWYFEKSPSGMTVDRHTGKVAWTPSEGGYAEVVLCARSLYGAVGRQSWSICVRKAAAVRVFKANARFLKALRRKALGSGGGARPGLSRLHFIDGFHPLLFFFRHWHPGPALRAPPPLWWRSRAVVPLRL